MNKSEQINWYKTFDKFRVSRVKQWTPKIYKELISMIKSATNESSINTAINRVTENVGLDKLSTLIQNIYVDAGRVMGAKAYQLVQKQGQKSMLPIGVNDELVAEIIQYYSLNILNQSVFPISETLRQWMLDRFIEAQQQGKSIQQVADELTHHAFPKNRAILIARTETIRSANYGAQQGVKKAGFATNKIWISAHDFRTRRQPKDQTDHWRMDGLSIPMDEDFHVPDKKGGYDLMQRPGDSKAPASQVINCRCTLGFSVLRNSSGLPIRV